MNSDHIPLCVGCGQIHGSIGGHILCLESSLRLEREKTRALSQTVEEFKRFARDANALPVSRGGMVEDLKKTVR